METTHHEIGPVILKIADLQSEMTLLRERIHGAQNHTMESTYTSRLREMESDLTELKHLRRKLRMQELEALQERLRKIEYLFNESIDMIEEQDLRDLQQDIRNRIETLQKVINNETQG